MKNAFVLDALRCEKRIDGSVKFQMVGESYANRLKSSATGRKLSSLTTFSCLERCKPAFFQEDEPLQVVAGRFEVQRKGGAHDAQALHEFSADLRQCSEHMLDTGAPSGDPAVPSLLRSGNTFGGVAPAGCRHVSRPV